MNAPPFSLSFTGGGKEGKLAGLPGLGKSPGLEGMIGVLSCAPYWCVRSTSLAFPLLTCISLS